MNCLIPGRFGTRAALAVLVLLGLVQAGASILLIRSVDSILGGSLDTTGAWTLAVPAVAVLVLAIGRLIELWQAERLAQRIVHAVRVELGKHLLNLPPRGRKSGRSEVLLRFMGEMSALRSWHMRAVPVIVIGTPIVVGGLTVLALRDFWLGVAALVPILVAVILQALLTRTHLAAADGTRRARSRLAGTVASQFDALATIQSFGRTDAATRRIEKRSARLAEAMTDRAWHAGSLRAAAELGSNGILVTLPIVWFLNPGIDGSAIVAAMAFAAVLSPRLRALGRIPEQFNIALVAQRRIDTFLSEAPLENRAEDAGIARREGHLVLRGVTINNVFQGFSARARPGDRVLVKGANGAGKSRLFGMIAGVEDPDDGKIVLDGRDTGRRRRSALHKLVTIAGDGMPLLAGTVAQNVVCGSRATPEEQDEILSLCEWDTLEATLPQGASTRIRTGAPELSAGQRAHISLIRALMRKPLILILDEVDGSLDATGRTVLSNLIGWFDGTVLIASHDPRWETVATNVWNLDAAANENCKETLDA